MLAEAFHRGTDESTATAFYGGTLAVIGLFVNATWQYAARGHRLLGAHLPAGEAQQISRRYLGGPLVYAVATVVGLVLPWLALLLYLLLNVFYLWPARVHEDARARTAEPGASTPRGNGDGESPHVPAARPPAT